MADATKGRTVAYIRLACEDDSAIEAQKEAVLRYAAENGYHDISVYADNGASGNNFNRAGFSKMMEDIDKGSINTVIVKSIDRISRDIVATWMWIDEMAKKGVVVETSDGLCDTRGCV